LNNALTKFIFSYRRKASKYAAIVLGLFVGFGFIGTANAVQTGQVTITCAKSDGTQRTNTVGWDNSNIFFNGKGDIARLYCEGGYAGEYRTFITTSVSDLSLRYYQGVLPIVDSPTATTETHTAQVLPSEETSTVPSSPQETETQLSVPETGTVLPVLDSESTTSDSQTAETPLSPSIQDTSSVVLPPQDLVLETATVVDTQTSESSTQTIPVETPTVPTETPLPIPVPVVEPQPVPVVVVPQPEPQPEIVPEPLPEPIPEESPLEEVAPEPAPPAPAEQPPADAPSEPPVVEDTSETPSDPAPEEQPAPTPLPLPQPIVEPAPTSQPEIAYQPPTVTLDNGVILTQEVAAAVALLSSPTELLSELFTDPGAVLTALGSVGADMSPEVREQSEKVVVSAIIAGGIATQAAASAAGAAAYRRKP
jgi:hypothetical protein